VNFIQVGVAVFYNQDVPAVGFIALTDIFCECKVGGTVDGNVIVIVEGNQLA
jgi:hypothetical protein